jgi:hypothetical protein
VLIAVAGPHPTIVPLVVVLGLALLSGVALLVFLTRDQGPSPADVALSYERAWDELDFAALWILSGPGLRDGRTREQFVRDKRAAYDGALLGHLSVSTTIVGLAPEESADRVTVTTRVDPLDGDAVTDEIIVERIEGAWRVVDYRLAVS